MTVHSILTHTLTKLINLCIYLKLSALPMELLVFFFIKGQSTTYTINVIPLDNSRTSPAISVSNVLPLYFLECTRSATETLQGEQGSLRGSSYCLLCSSVARGGKDSTAETLSHPCFPMQCLISSCLRLRSPQACTPQAGYSREPVLQFSLNQRSGSQDSG